MYFKGLLGAIDYPKAKYYYEKAAKHNYSNAFVMLAKIYKKGLGVKQDYVRARKYYELAIQNKNVEVFLKLGILYENGLGVDVDYTKAIHYYQLSAKTNNSKAFLKLGNIYMNGLGVDKNYFLAIKNYSLSAKLNNPTALFILGKLYSTGNIVTANTQRAIQYLSDCIQIDKYNLVINLSFENAIFKKLKSNKYRYHACNELGLIFITDENQDIEKAFLNIKVSAFAEFPFAQNNYGILNQFFQNKINDIEHMYRRASEHSFALAEYNLGKIKEDEKKINESIEFYRRASEHEDVPLIFHNEIYNDKRLEISKTFILCLTNLKLTKYYLEVSKTELAKEYFYKSLHKISKYQSYKFLFIFPKKCTKIKFDYIKYFIFNYPLFNMINQPNLPKELIPILNIQNGEISTNKKYKERETNDIILSNINLSFSKHKNIKKNLNKFEANNSIIMENEKSNDIVFDNINDLFDFATQNDEIKQEFINEIDEIMKIMNSILYEPPYRILFGRINIEKTRPKNPIPNITELFYEGLGKDIYIKDNK